jgi:hypothetical protein
MPLLCSSTEHLAAPLSLALFLFAPILLWSAEPDTSTSVLTNSTAATQSLTPKDAKQALSAKLTAGALAVGLTFVAGGRGSLGQETIHVSFLDTGAPLASTIKFLTSHGCKADAVASFAEAVNQYNSVPLTFELSKFPRGVDGVFTFQSVTQLVAALPGKLRDTPHTFELNCFDAVLVLTAGQLRSELGPDDVFGVSLAPKMMDTNAHGAFSPVATARDAFNFSYPTWYQDWTKPYIPGSAVSSRMNLTVALYGFYVLPQSTEKANLAGKVLDTLIVNWRRQGIMFPTTCEVVLCHLVNVPHHIISTFHAGLLFRRAGGYTYLEKDSGCGPFVRLDFEAEGTLLPWLATKADRPLDPEWQNDFYATFNDTRIEKLNVVGKPDARMKPQLHAPNRPAEPQPR